MAALTHEERRAGLEFAAQLSLLAAMAPDVLSEREVHKAARRIRDRYSYSPDLKKAEIFARIRRGAASISELIEETGFHKDEVYEITRQLESEKRIRIDAIQTSDKGGRPALRFFIAELSFSPPKN